MLVVMIARIKMMLTKMRMLIIVSVIVKMKRTRMKDFLERLHDRVFDQVIERLRESGIDFSK